MSLENNDTKVEQKLQPKIPRGILIISVLTILFGLAEVATAFSHEFFGITTSQSTLATIASAIIGLLYIAAGLSILTMKRRGANLAIILLICDVVGRLAIVAIGLYPMNTLENAFGIITGTTIAVVFAIYIGIRRSSFQ